MRKRLIIFIGLLAAVGLIAAKGTQVFAPFFTVSGELKCGSTVTDALTVDSPTLVVDATNNRVGIGTATPSRTLDVNGIINCNSQFLFPLGATATIAQHANTRSCIAFSYPDLTIRSGSTAGTLKLQTTPHATGYISIGDVAAGLTTQTRFLDNGMVTVGGDSAGTGYKFKVVGAANITTTVNAGDSVVAADRIKAGDNTTYSYFDPGDAGLTQSSSRKIKDLKGLVSVNVSDFMSVPVYKWKYKKEYSNSNKEHYGAVSEDFQRVCGDGKTINYEKAFWYLWAMVQEQQKEIYAIKNSSGSILNGTFRDSHSRE